MKVLLFRLFILQELFCSTIALSSRHTPSQRQQLQQHQHYECTPTTCVGSSRRDILTSLTLTALVLLPKRSNGLTPEEKLPDTFDVDSYLRTGFVSNPMGVSGQAGKSKPETGVILRDGSDVNRDSRTGDVLAEILIQSRDPNVPKMPVFVSFQSPWPLASGTVFDVECRNPNTGDGSFLAVTGSTYGKDITELPDSFFLETLISPTSRFSFYGTPTDVKIKKSQFDSKKYKIMDVAFSTLSQSTQTEIPRRARIIATIPDGGSQAVMLVGSSSSQRWKRGSEEDISKVIESFRAIPAPTTSLKVRAKERRSG